jgi:hypothetical protein
MKHSFIDFWEKYKESSYLEFFFRFLLFLAEVTIFRILALVIIGVYTIAKSWKKTVIACAIMTAIIIITGCNSQNVPTNNEEVKMSSLRFFASYPFTLPSSPGVANTEISMAPNLFDGGPFMGMSIPIYQGPNDVNPTFGCSNESNLRLKAYRISFLGAAGLRPSPIDPESNPNGFNIITAGRYAEQGNQIFIPFTSSGDWQTLDKTYIVKADEPLNIQKVPQMFFSVVHVDTRNLQDIYYGSEIRVLIELDVECVADLLI